MKHVNIKRLNYSDKVALRHRRIFILKAVLGLVGVTAGVIGLGYVLFFSDHFQVKEFSLNGLDTLSREYVMGEVNSILDSKFLRYLQPQRSIVFFSSEQLRDKLLAQAVLKSVTIKKKFPHEISVDFVERKPLGIWCFRSLCQYFDNERVTWGQIGKSSGFLFLTIEDRREREAKIDEQFYDPIMSIISNLPDGLMAKNVVVPEDSFTDFLVYTDKSYYLMFSLESDIKAQLDVLKIFLNDKKGNAGFNPQYLDLRLDGRVYYK